MKDSTRRFTDRVGYYVRSRPGYPSRLAQTLRTETALPEGAAVADIGSGTGISTALLLSCGWTVYAVEPNEAMRHAAERVLRGNPRFRSVAGAAEATGLPSASVDMVAAGQAFHWFSPEKAQEEFKRILRPGGWVALFWNARQDDTTPFLEAYEELLQTYGTDYSQTKHRNVSPQDIRRFLPSDYQFFTFSNEQRFDFDGLKGRVLSSSYTPQPGHPLHEPLLAALEATFNAHHEQRRSAVPIHDGTASGKARAPWRLTRRCSRQSARTGFAQRGVELAPLAADRQFVMRHGTKRSVGRQMPEGFS